MSRNKYFQFKQFRIIQEKSAMKVGTDGVLLGAWVDIFHTEKILDIGTGTGLIALMMAQRSGVKISGVEIEENAFHEALFNVEQSPWKERVSLYHISFQEFAEKTDEKFDLIVTNPPFFENDLPPSDKNRLTAKHTLLLPYVELLAGVRKILHNSGRFAIILPVLQAKKFERLAQKQNLWLSRLTKVKANPEKSPHRWLMEFCFSETQFHHSELIIEAALHHDYTQEYKELTKDFYLAF